MRKPTLSQLRTMRTIQHSFQTVSKYLDTAEYESARLNSDAARKALQDLNAEIVRIRTLVSQLQSCCAQVPTLLNQINGLLTLIPFPSRDVTSRDVKALRQVRQQFDTIYSYVYNVQASLQHAVL